MYSPGSAIWLSGTAPLHRGFPNFWGDGGGGGVGKAAIFHGQLRR